MTRRLLVPVLLLALTACTAPALREAEQRQQRGDFEGAWRLLRDASQAAPTDQPLRVAEQRQRERALLALATQAESARASGQLDLATALLERLQQLDAQAPRVRALDLALQRARRHAHQLQEAERHWQARELDAARASVQRVLAEDPGQPQALALQQRLRQQQAALALPSSLGVRFHKPLALEFRDTPLRTVFEALTRAAGVNFVFDREVKVDAKVTLALQGTSLDEAMRILLATQQLERKLLNEQTVFIYPATQAKQREHQELVTRSFYLNNADVKQAQALVRMMAKTRDVFIDERLNLLVARDTPEVVAQIEQLVAGLDLPEPEVMLDVEVLEIESSRNDELGLNWASDVQYGLPGGAAVVEWAQRDAFRTLVANPVLAARLKGGTGASNLLANPKLRTRSREKARIQIGEKVPVFTSTSTANVGVSTAVTYLDVGLKLEVEPTVLLDNEVVMKVQLEVSSLGTRESSGGPQPTSAYRIGTRNAATSLRLRDGETQVLAGLINDEDRKSINGLPYLSEVPLLGRLFGVHGDNRKKTEIVLLITPRVLRNVQLPDATRSQIASGVDANPGQASLRLRPSAQVLMPAAGSQAAPTVPGSEAALELQTTLEASEGETVSVTLANRSAQAVQATLRFDAALLQAAEVGAESRSGQIDVELPAQGQRVVVLRTQPGSGGTLTTVELLNVRTVGGPASAPALKVFGDGQVQINPR